jgi:aspartyl/glutamyl-tRNA(Asn/Gln) amidotransferase C subunit
MAKITPEEIKNLFELSRLPFDEARVVSAQKDMEDILGYVASLGRLDTSGTEEVHGGADFLNAFRPDEAIPASSEDLSRVTESFPRNEAGLNKVPSILSK